MVDDVRAIVVLLVILEIVRRIGSFASCYVDLRYDPLYAVVNPEAVIAAECYGRHIIFPFRLFVS